MIRTGLAVLAAVAVSAAFSAQAQDDRERARAEFQRGVERYAADDFSGALDAFQEAYRLAPHPSVRVNMANCYEQLNRPLEAIFHYERYLIEDAAGPAEQRTEVSQALERLRQTIGPVRLNIQPDGARVRIDGSDEVRRTPIRETISMTAGNHTVEISLDGYTTVTREFIVVGGQPAEVSVELQRATETGEPVTDPTAEGAAGLGVSGQSVGASNAGGSNAGGSSVGGSNAPPPPEDTTEEGGGFALSAPTLIAGGASVLLLAGALVAGIISLGAQSDFDDADAMVNDSSLSLAERQAAHDESVDAADRADAAALATDILGIAGAVGLGLTAYFFITDLTSGERAEARIRATPVALPEGGGGVIMQGSF